MMKKSLTMCPVASKITVVWCMSPGLPISDRAYFILHYRHFGRVSAFIAAWRFCYDFPQFLGFSQQFHMGTNAHPRSQFLGRRCAARIMGWIIGIITTILGIAAGFGGGVLYRKRVAERAIGSPSIQSHKRRDSQQFRIARYPAAARLLFVMGFAVPGGRGGPGDITKMEKVILCELHRKTNVRRVIYTILHFERNKH